MAKYDFSEDTDQDIAIDLDSRLAIRRRDPLTVALWNELVARDIDPHMVCKYAGHYQG
jgi:hypothetical protein